MRAIFDGDTDIFDGLINYLYLKSRNEKHPLNKTPQADIIRILECLFLEEKYDTPYQSADELQSDIGLLVVVAAVNDPRDETALLWSVARRGLKSFPEETRRLFSLAAAMLREDGNKIWTGIVGRIPARIEAGER